MAGGETVFLMGWLLASAFPPGTLNRTGAARLARGVAGSAAMDRRREWARCGDTGLQDLGW